MSAYDTGAAGLSVIGLGLVGFVATQGSSDFHKNPKQIEAILQTNAEVALDEANLDWASVVIDGQKATLGGQPPSEDSAALAEQTVLTSVGRGGMLFGGVVDVETDFSEVAPLPVASPYVWRAIKSENGKISLRGIKTSMIAQNRRPASLMGTGQIRLSLGYPNWNCSTAEKHDCAIHG